MTTDQKFGFDTSVQDSGLSYLRWLRDAEQASGRTLFSMVKEMVSLGFGPGKISPEEYFQYRLYDDNRYTPEAKRTFAGYKAEAIASPWKLIAQDKLTICALLRGLELPTTVTQAIWNCNRRYAGAITIESAEDAKNFLRKDANYPIFGKPLDSSRSLSVASIEAYDSDADELVMTNGQRIDVETFVQELDELGIRYIFQTALQAHPELEPILGDRVSTVRMFVLMDENGCHLFRASWKIPVGDNRADNFWRTGNLLAGIDVETGKITRAFERLENGDLKEVDTHPIAKTDFSEYVFPCWDEMREVVLRAAEHFASGYVQGWDVALTNEGPVLVELEGDGGDIIMEQLCFDTGMLQEPFFNAKAYAASFIERQRQRLKQIAKSQVLQSISQLSTPLRDETPGAEESSKEQTERSEHASNEAVAESKEEVASAN